MMKLYKSDIKFWHRFSGLALLLFSIVNLITRFEILCFGNCVPKKLDLNSPNLCLNKVYEECWEN